MPRVQARRRDLRNQYGTLGLRRARARGDGGDLLPRRTDRIGELRDNRAQTVEVLRRVESPAFFTCQSSGDEGGQPEPLGTPVDERSHVFALVGIVRLAGCI